MSFLKNWLRRGAVGVCVSWTCIDKYITGVKVILLLHHYGRGCLPVMGTLLTYLKNNPQKQRAGEGRAPNLTTKLLG